MITTLRFADDRMQTTTQYCVLSPLTAVEIDSTDYGNEYDYLIYSVVVGTVLRIFMSVTTKRCRSCGGLETLALTTSTTTSVLPFNAMLLCRLPLRLLEALRISKEFE